MAYEIMTAIVVFKANCQCAGLLNASATKSRRGGRCAWVLSAGAAGRTSVSQSADSALRTPITAGDGSPLAPTSCAGGGGGSCVAAAAPDSMTCLQARN